MTPTPRQDRKSLDGPDLQKLTPKQAREIIKAKPDMPTEEWLNLYLEATS